MTLTDQLTNLPVPEEMRTGIDRLDAALQEFFDAFVAFMVTQLSRVLMVMPEIAEAEAYRRLMVASAWVESERQLHAATALFAGSAHYDDETIAEILGGVR